ncbi:stromal interaction molecule 1-like [Grus americana]|uniref:stromal interaction molecule 1-like n=1 Tax=Grus americana TaxID=9117 RepID=UPI0024080EFB|nr:stromal interaction molecule 1-like [Grus americana]
MAELLLRESDDQQWTLLLSRAAGLRSEALPVDWHNTCGSPSVQIERPHLTQLRPPTHMEEQQWAVVRGPYQAGEFPRHVLNTGPGEAADVSERRACPAWLSRAQRPTSWGDLCREQHGPRNRDLTRCDSDSSIPHLSDHQRIPSSAPKLLAARPNLLTRSIEEAAPGHPAIVAPTPNGGSRHAEASALGALPERLPESPMVMKKMMMVNHGMEKSSSLGEISHPTAGKHSHSDSSRSHSPSSTDPDTPSPISDCRPSSAKSTRIPQLAAKKSPGDEDSSLTGDEVDLGQSKKKFPLKIFKKPKK